MVRTDLDGVLKDKHDWKVTVSKSDCPPSAGGSGGAAGAGAGGVGGIGGASAGGAGVAGGGVGGVSGGVVAGSAGVTAIAGSAPVPMTAPPPQDSSGCGCAVPGSSPRDSRVIFVLGALGLASRRRRRRR
jgi:MYXO-CTERM domain-containing protein